MNKECKTARNVVGFAIVILVVIIVLMENVL